MRKHTKRIQAVGAAALLVLVVAACGSDSADDADSSSEPTGTVSVSEAWSRKPAAGQMTGGVYALVTNGTDADVTMIGASSPVSDDVQLHETIKNDDGTMQMRRAADGFVVSAGETFSFESGGPHIMLMGVDADTYPTDSVEITLEFEGSAPVAFDAEVRDVVSGDMDDMDHDEMDHDDMDHDDMDEAEIDPGVVLHELADELTAGTLDAEHQLATVNEVQEFAKAHPPAEDSPEYAEFIESLETLRTALADGDVEAAAAAANLAHEQAHALEDTH